jgi:hypothetical protein
MSAGSFHPIVPPWYCAGKKFNLGDRVRVVFRGVKGPSGKVTSPPPPPGDSRGFLGMYEILFDDGTTKRLLPDSLELLPPEDCS